MTSRIDELTRRLHADPENHAVRARLVAERKRVFGHSNFTGSLLDPSDVFAFVLAGRAKFTLQSTKSGRHLTFRVKQKTTKVVKDGVKKPIKHPFWFVNVMTGVNNDGPFTRLGTISGDARDFSIDEGQFTRQDPLFLTFNETWRHAKMIPAAPS